VNWPVDKDWIKINVEHILDEYFVELIEVFRLKVVGWLWLS